MSKIAVIRISGKNDLKKEIKDTFKMLRAYKKNNCVVLENTPSNLGMVNRLKDHITWGEIDQETFKLLLEKRAKLVTKKITINDFIKQKLNTDLNTFTKDFFESKRKLKDIPGMKLFFGLHPPIKGYERKGTKLPFSLGGVLGYRKDKINDLIKRML